MNQNAYRTIERGGVFVTFALSVFLHFYNGTEDFSALSILFCAANDSIWEHIKTIVLPTALWALIELMLIKMPFRRFFVAKVFSLYLCSFLSLLFFYIYSLFCDKNYLVANIVFSFIAISFCTIVANKLINTENIEQYFHLCVALLMLLFVMFFCFTISPPHIDIFKDPLTGLYSLDKVNGIT